MREYPPLGSISRALSCVFAQTRPAPTRVGPEAPALDAMTDFARVAAATIGRSASLAIANVCMFTRSVRSLFVVAPKLEKVRFARAGHVVASLTQTGRQVDLARTFAAIERPLAGSG